MISALHRIVAGLIRRTWLVALATLALCGTFAAHAVAAFRAPGEPAPVAVTRPAGSPRIAAARPVPDGSGLVERNMFCSACVAVHAAGPAGAMSTFVPAATLIATSVGSTSARATVRVTASDAQGSWTLGDVIPGIGTIARIGYASIDVVDAEGRTGKLSLLDTKPLVGDLGAATPVASPAATPFDDRVRKLDDHTYEVDRALVRELVTGAAGGSTKSGIRATPVLKNGELDGLRLLAVTPGSAPAAIGLKSGDILSAIDGEPIRSAQQMITLYSKLDKLDTVELQGMRVGKPLAVRLNLK